ncbi:MAG: RagB/SusD family nutrient uptake outer membrane protein [Bacteroidales bacterium]|jgi:hypothetical protein|nr:RagB/SusD family nutrient uptake outer membrane protein [Bacteroidales bacterium]
MNKYHQITSVTAILTVIVLASCTKFLDIVPDNTAKLEDVFNTREEAYNALAKVYSYLPDDNRAHYTTWTMGDEYVHRLDYETNASYLLSVKIMRGLQSATNPILGSWSGTYNGKPYYEAIRQCNLFLQNIDLVKNMESFEKDEWRAQVIFMKAYYHWLLVQKYGPVIISDEVVSPEASRDAVFLKRAKVDDCYDYIIGLIDQAMPKLKPKIENQVDYGMVDRMVAKSIKARILLFRASPLSNGNMEYFGDFLDFDGKPYFPVTTDREKWKKAGEAIDEAIALCEEQGKALYTFDKAPYSYDREFFENNPERMQTLWNLRMVNTDPWNNELIWGMSNVDFFGSGTNVDCEIGATINMRLPNSDEFASTDKNSVNWANQWMCATYAMAERYYTENGVPVDEDRTFPYSMRHALVTTPDPSLGEADEIAMKPLLGLLQPNTVTINLYMNREMRFYANLGITGGYWRAHQCLIPVSMWAGSYGGLRDGRNEDCFVTGIGIQKFIHPESGAGGWQRIVKFPYPIIRLADLYLMQAEAWNEYEGPSQKVYNALNKVRRRAGIPDVEEVWADAGIVKSVNYHTTQAGLREIILRERSIEFAFEGSRFQDMLRHKKAPAEFSRPVQGWMHTGSTPQTFFILGVKQSRNFSIRDCLWPIDLNELNTNRNLKQNPGW